MDLPAGSNSNGERSKCYHRKRRRSRSLSILACDGGSLLRVLISSRSPLEELHRLFPFLPAEEFPLNVFTCALSKEILLQGKMFVSQNWICFYSNIFGYETKVTIEIKKIVSLCREKTAFVVPNAISIQIPNKRFFFCSFLSRETVFRLLSRTWQAAAKDKTNGHLEDGGLNLRRRIGTFDEFDNNHNAMITSLSEFSIEPREVWSDTDLHLIRFSTPILDRNRTSIYPKIVNSNGFSRLDSCPAMSLKKHEVHLTKWHTAADLTDMKRTCEMEKAAFLRRRHRLPMLKDRKHLSANETVKSSVVRSIQSVTKRMPKTLKSIMHRLVRYTSIYLFISIIIIILGIMTLFLLYKINNLSQTFAERDAGHSTLCKSSNMKLPSPDQQTAYRGKLERVNDILSTNLKAVYEVQDSLRKLKKNLDP